MTQVLRLQRRGLTTFQGFIADQSPVEILYVEGNAICNFEGLGTQPYLRELHAQNNHITSFAGMTAQRSLQVLNLGGNPVSRHPYYRLMALLTVGASLRVIDGVDVTSTEKDQAIRLGRHAAIAVNCGWLLDGQSHTVEEYASITENLKRARRTTVSVGSVGAPSVPRTGGLVSPQDSPGAILPEQSVPLLARRPTVSAQNQPTVRRSSPTQQEAVYRDPNAGTNNTATSNETAHVIAQLHAQIANLRTQMDDYRLRLQKEQQTCEKLRTERAQACDLGTYGLGMEEIRTVSRMEFGGGIKLSTNVIFTTAVGQPPRGESGGTNRIPSAHISVDSQYMYISHHFTRVRMGEIPLTEIKDVVIDGTIVFIRLHDATVFEMTFEEQLKAASLYKAIHFFQGILPAPVKGAKPLPTTNVGPTAREPQQQTTSGYSKQSQFATPPDTPTQIPSRGFGGGGERNVVAESKPSKVAPPVVFRETDQSSTTTTNSRPTTPLMETSRPPANAGNTTTASAYAAPVAPPVLPSNPINIQSSTSYQLPTVTTSTVTAPAPSIPAASNPISSTTYIPPSNNATRAPGTPPPTVAPPRKALSPTDDLRISDDESPLQGKGGIGRIVLGGKIFTASSETSDD
eukprot:PhF_6_TR27913/c0_g1_i1/m.40998